MVLQIARAPAAAWAASSKILADGQLGVARNPDGTTETRIGDGSHTWSGLPAESVPNTVRSVSQTLSTGEQTQARQNIRALSRDVIVDAVSEGVPTDGSTSAAAPLNTAQALLPSTGGLLLLRRGIYNMTTRTTITKQGMVFEGEGPDATVLSLASAALQVGASDVIIRGMTIKSNTAGTDRSLYNNVTTGAWKNWRFEDCVFDNVQCVSSAIGAFTDSGGGVTLTSAAGLTDHVEFDHCEFKNTLADGVCDFRGVEFVTVNRCWFHNLGLSTGQGDALKFEYGTSRFRATDNDFNDLTRDAIDCYDGQIGIVSRNMIKNTGVNGIEVKVTATSGVTNSADRFQIVDNQLYNTGAGAAISTSSPNVLIANNYMEAGALYGLRSTYKTNGTDRNNDVQWVGNRAKGFTAGSKPAFSALGIDGLIVIANSATNSYQGFNVPLGSLISQNQSVIGGATMNSSRNNTNADVWT